MVFSDALRAQLYGADLKRAAAYGYKERTYAEIVGRSLRGNPDDTAQALVINTWLTGNALLNCDKVTMAHSLEARVPFFDPALLDFAAAVPPEIRMKRNKYVLREAMRPLLPEFALERPKKAVRDADPRLVRARPARQDSGDAARRGRLHPRPVRPCRAGNACCAIISADARRRSRSSFAC